MHTCIYISPQLVHARLCNGAAASLPWNLLRTYLESCANIMQAAVSAHPPAPSSSRPPSCWPVARHFRLRNPIKSTLAHYAVAAVVLHKHHLIIRVGAGLIQFVCGSHSRLAADLTLDKNQFSLPFSQGVCVCEKVCDGKTLSEDIEQDILIHSLNRCLYSLKRQKTRELQTQLLHYFSKSDNKSNHHQADKHSKMPV